MDKIFRFANYYYLLLLLVVPLVWYLQKRYLDYRKALMGYSNVTMFAGIGDTLRSKLYKSLPYVNFVIISLIIIALARPQYGQKTIEIITHGVDIVLTVDISGSMAAEDFKPNRLEASKKVIKDFIHRRMHDRIGIVIFSGQSYTHVPLTLDYDILYQFIDKIKLGMLEDGTAIGTAIASSVNRLRNSDAKSKVIVLLTDGENNFGEIDPITAAKLADAVGIKIYTIGVGKKGGAPVPIVHPQYGKIYARNQDGSVYMTKLDERSLREIARTTNGKYFRADNPKKLSEIYKKIDELEKTKMKTKEYDNYNEMATYFMVPALVLLMLELLLKVTWLRRIP